MEIYIRPLKEEDSFISFRWRNDPEIWALTGNKPNKIITPEIELEWIKNILSRVNEKRFAICIKETNEYIGNVQLTDITNENAQFHIFIGEKAFHGKGIGTKATRLILEYAFAVLKLKQVYLKVKQENVAAIKSYKKCEFKFKEIVNGELLLICYKESYFESSNR